MYLMTRDRVPQNDTDSGSNWTETLMTFGC